jgi:hypothetical protein
VLSRSRLSKLVFTAFLNAPARDEALTGDISSGSGVENDFPAPGLARRTTETKKV